MAGLVPAIHVLPRDRFVKIVPVRIESDNLPDLPCARPMLDVVLALNSIADVVELLEIHQPLQSVSPGETCDEPGAMLIDATYEVARHADIQNTVPTVRHNVDPATCHAGILQDVD